ncbi:MAG: YSC84-related protein [Sulfurovum sp.]|nr:YSC84-related protein [Sulfurovum sp.]
MNTIKYKVVLLAILIGFSTFSMAKSAKTLDHDANMAINKFIDETKGGDAFLVNAKAFLVFPDIKEGGFFIGGKYAEGVLRKKRETLGYYEIVSASVGFQMGVQEYSMIIAFTTDAALERFLMDEDEWETDVDGKITIAEWNSKEELDDVEFKGSMVAFVFDSKGIMGSYTMEGTKFKKINPN